MLNKTRLIFLLLTCLFFEVDANAQQNLTSVDFYGIRELSEQEIRNEIGLKKGIALKVTSKELKGRLKKIEGVIDCDVVQIQYPGNYALFIGIKESGTKKTSFRSEPTGKIQLDPELLTRYDAIMELLIPAIRSGKAGEDQSAGHSLSEYDPMRKKQVALIEIANQKYSFLSKVLKESSDVKSRAAAAYILAYAAGKKKVVSDLSFACNDPSSLVRNNAVRALGLLAKYGKKNPDAKLEISYEPFLQMLKSLKWTDRNKGAAFFDSMTIDCDKELTDTLKNHYLLELEEMARWKSQGHSLFSIRILARIAGLGEGDILKRCRGLKTYAQTGKFVDTLLLKIRGGKNRLDQELIGQLDRMVKIDQLAASNAFPPTEFKHLTQKQWENKKTSIFKENQKVLEKILKDQGFPGFNLVGKEGSKNFWLMVQHCDHDPKFQQNVLKLMKTEVEKSNASGVYFAYLTDRVSLNTGKKQIYGTQVKYNLENAQAIPKSLADRKSVNERRKSIGLPLIEIYLNQLSKAHFHMNKETYEKKGIKNPKLYPEK